jgi:hypothetical protein
MAKTKVGINGFGRIGRQVFRTIAERHGDSLEVVAINDLGSAEVNAHLFKYDSTYGVYQGTVEASGNDLIIDGKTVKVLSERNPADLPWSDVGVELVVESTGIFTDASKAAGHLNGGAKPPRPRAKTSQLSWASTRINTIRLSTRSSPTHPAQPTVSHRWPRFFTIPSASRAH